MAGFGFLILFGLGCLLFSCEGKVSPPTEGTSLIFARGSTRRIVWSYDDVIETLSRRIWTFKSSDGKLNERLAFIDGDGDVNILTRLIEVGVEKPATLVLKNVNETYNGTYKFELSPTNGVSESEVVVFIAVTPMVTVECSSPTAVNIGDTFTCVCKGQGGNPPADVTWFKGNEQKGGTGKGEQILRLPNVKKEDSGAYRCEAKSHEEAKNDTEIELIVNYPAENVKLMLTRSGKSVTITCEADGRPPPSFKIFLNETKLVISDKTYTIPEVNSCHAGNYKCVAMNVLGNKSSFSKYLSSEDKAFSNNTIYRTEWYIVVVSLVSGIIIGILLSYIVSCSRRKFRSRNYPQSNPETQATVVDTTYQELDLSKINTEDNYQSLRVNAASNDEESTYTELNTARDVEDNYQSLT